MPAVLLNNTYLGVERIDLLAIETGIPEFALPVGDGVAFFATRQAAVLMRARLTHRSRENGRVGLRLTQAAPRTQAMLVGTVRLPADCAAEVLAARMGRVAPLPAVLAEGDPWIGASGMYHARPPQDHDALPDEALRSGSPLGVPDVEEYLGSCTARGFPDDMGLP